MKNISVEKSYKKCAGETIPRPVYPWISSVKFQSLLLLYANLRAVEV